MELKKEKGENKKHRKPNFTTAEVIMITEEVEKNLETLRSKFTNDITNKSKNEVWRKIADRVNAAGVHKRTPQEVRDKWKNLTSKAKKDFTIFKNESRRTGGGPPPKKPNQATEKIISLFEEDPSFSGLQGFDSGEILAYFKISGHVIV